MSMIGKTLGHYQITNQLGKGGMGEVFQAKDQILGREVAIKVLPEEFARDTDRVARFQREAKVLASLNHPNIAAIHGLEQSERTNFLVLELVEGQTLADRIKAGPIPVEESLKLALQIAEALEAAHEKGVIHRDLKPANIKVTSKGKVKVLDFGLAKAFAGEKADLNLSDSATLSMLGTQPGVIVGTAAYMSPEQARGEGVDKRADIWAFGVVLYEMLTGRQPFVAGTIPETIAAVLTKEPDWKKITRIVLPMLSRCLQKNSDKRLRDIGDVKLDLEEVLANPDGRLVVTGLEPRTKLRMMLPWVAVAIVLAAIIAGVALWKLRKPEPRQVTRFYYELPEGQRFSNLALLQLAVSPNGKQFVYSTNKGLYLRSADELTAKLITGTEGDTNQPFFSPDGKWIGYYSVGDQKLKKISINGGIPTTLLEGIGVSVPSWGSDNTIIFGVYPGSAIMRISADGGTPETLVKGKAWIIYAPQILPDGKSMLYTEQESPTQRKIMVQTVKSGKPKELFPGIAAHYLPTGHLVYAVSDKVCAVPFDVDRLEVSGESVPLVEGVRQAALFSDSGTLAYIPEPPPAVAPGRILVWVSRNGQEEPLAATPNIYRFPQISPDGKRVALARQTGGNFDIWIWNLAQRNWTRLTFDGKANITPVWSPDCKQIAFYSELRAPAGNWGSVYWKSADGTGGDEILGLFGDRAFYPYCWSSDGKSLIGTETLDRATFDISVLSMEGGRVRKPLLQEKHLETQPKISHNGRWITYTSDETGRNEVYVCSFPDVNKGKWQISAGGGDSPLWSPDGHELFYLNGDAVMATSVQTDPSFMVVGTEKVLFRGRYVSSYPIDGTPWDIHPDGKRFLMMKELGAASADEGPRRINIILNWIEELKQRVPIK